MSQAHALSVRRPPPTSPGTQARPLRLTLDTPLTRAGPLHIDPLRALLGKPLADHLTPWMEGPAVPELSPPARLIHPLAIAEGVQARLELGLATLELGVVKGRLTLLLPTLLAGPADQALGPWVHSRQQTPTGTRLHLELPPRTRVAIALPLVGEIGLEVV